MPLRAALQLTPVPHILAKHWLAIANSATAFFLALPFLAPLLLQQGRADLANLIYSAYQVTCHEWPFRAYFLFGPQATYSLAELQALGLDVFGFRGSPELGYKVAFCSRNVAIYAAVLAAGLLYARVGQRLSPLSFMGYAFLIAPMAIDGLTQLVGWRESTWELRTLTGLLFGAASVWLVYPRLDPVLQRLAIARPAPRLAESAAG
jgi:uncharacterized membrane protein